jgi:hypothetical protein
MNATPFHATLVLSLSMLACGRSATTEDCKMIYEKNIEVEMRSLAKADDATIERKKAELRTAFDADLKQCVGKRVTESVLACVRGATTPEQMASCGH